MSLHNKEPSKASLMCQWPEKVPIEKKPLVPNSNRKYQINEEHFEPKVTSLWTFFYRLVYFFQIMKCDDWGTGASDCEQNRYILQPVVSNVPTIRVC